MPTQVSPVFFFFNKAISSEPTHVSHVSRCLFFSLPMLPVTEINNPRDASVSPERLPLTAKMIPAILKMLSISPVFL